MKVHRLIKYLEDCDQNFDVLVRDSNDFSTVGRPEPGILTDDTGAPQFVYVLPLAEHVGEATDTDQVDDWLRKRGWDV